MLQLMILSVIILGLLIGDVRSLLQVMAQLSMLRCLMMI